MNTASFLVLGTNLLLIGLLPKIFFKPDGRFNFMWWVTAFPFFSAALVLVLTYIDLIPLALTDAGVISLSLEIVAVLLSMVSIGLITFTLGTHNRRIALWHQNNDAPEHIVTHGSYRYVRHPFYTAFLITLIAVVCLIPHISTVLIFVYALLLLNATARREEVHLSNSIFGDEYRVYLSRTGRFIPKGNPHHA